MYEICGKQYVANYCHRSVLHNAVTLFAARILLLHFLIAHFAMKLYKYGLRAVAIGFNYSNFFSLIFISFQMRCQHNVKTHLKILHILVCLVIVTSHLHCFASFHNPLWSPTKSVFFSFRLFRIVNYIQFR